VPKSDGVTVKAMATELSRPNATKIDINFPDMMFPKPDFLIWMFPKPDDGSPRGNVSRKVQSVNSSSDRSRSRRHRAPLPWYGRRIKEITAA
jgi:hypothetical protein